MTRPKDEMGSQIVSSESDISHPILCYLSRNNNSQAQFRRSSTFGFEFECLRRLLLLFFFFSFCMPEKILLPKQVEGDTIAAGLVNVKWAVQNGVNCL